MLHAAPSASSMPSTAFRCRRRASRTWPRYERDLDLVERSHIQYLGVGNALRLAQPEFADRLVRALATPAARGLRGGAGRSRAAGTSRAGGAARCAAARAPPQLRPPHRSDRAHPAGRRRPGRPHRRDRGAGERRSTSSMPSCAELDRSYLQRAARRAPAPRATREPRSPKHAHDGRAAAGLRRPRGRAGSARHGRSDLPWQNTRDPYRVWLSEIMLQQTQVATVLGYYARFLAALSRCAPRWPRRSEDDVLGLWSGLGYYSRARNLHRCAQEVVARFGGAFPRTAARAGRRCPASAARPPRRSPSFCFGERVAILDGNVKRVLTRVLGFDGDLVVGGATSARCGTTPTSCCRRAGDARGHAALHAGPDGPGRHASACRASPRCLLCPVQRRVRGARAKARPKRYPGARRASSSAAPSRSGCCMRATRDGAVWLEKRPAPRHLGRAVLPAGVRQPRRAGRDALPAPARDGCRTREPFLHVLTHKDLHLHPVRGATLPPGRWRAGRRGRAGSAPAQWHALGLPAPVRKLLDAAR